MHISEANAFTSSTAALKKRKRDVVGGGTGTCSQENTLRGTAPAYQLDFQDINMLSSPPRFNVEPPTPTSTPTSSQRQWLHLQSAGNGAPDMQKKRRILQPHFQNHYQQQLRPHSGSPAAQSTSSHYPCQQHHHHGPRKPSPPALMIPFFDSRRDPEFATMSTTDEYDSVSPRTMTIPPRETSALPPPVLRPCHICHRKPSTKVMLDAYADCELCGQRACYICLRECNSSNCYSGSTTTPTVTKTTDEFDDDVMRCTDITREDGYLHTRSYSRIGPNEDGNGKISAPLQHRKVCSCCAVEGLTDTGEEIVWCLNCVRREEMNHQQTWQ